MTAPQINCYITIKGQQEFSFPINIGQDEQQSYPINDKDAHLIFRDGTTDLEKIKINDNKRSLGRDVGAGGGAGFITLLALVTTTTAVSGDQTWVSLDKYPQNVQSIVTLFVTCFIAGLVPFQILDKTTGQLVDTIKIKDSEKKALALYSAEKAAGIDDDLLKSMGAMGDPNVDDARKKANELKGFSESFI